MCRGQENEVAITLYPWLLEGYLKGLINLLLCEIWKGARWSSGYRTLLPIKRFGVQIPGRAEIWFEISAPPAPPSQLSYDEHTDH